jgi:hypothetical protein
MVPCCRDGKLVATAQQGAKNWAVSWAGPEINEWYFVELTWDPNGGLKMFVDLKQVSSDSRGFMRDAGQSGAAADGESLNYFYLGRCDGDMSDKAYGSATIDDLDIWYGERSKLIELDFIARGELWPQNFLSESEA